MTQTRIAEMTADELRQLIREVVAETLLDLLGDPDQGLDLQEQIAERLQHSLSAVEAGSVTRSAEEVAARLGLEW